MKRILSVLVLGMLFQGQAMARVFSVEKTENINKRLEELKEIILDVENMCDQGCKYKLSNVREIRTLENEDPNHFYTWYYIDAMRDSSFFQENIITNPSPNETHIVATYPKREKMKELREKYKVSQKTLFDTLESRYELKENFDESGNFLNTTVKYYNKVTSDSAIIRMFAGTVRAEMNRTAEDMFKNLK